MAFGKPTTANHRPAIALRSELLSACHAQGQSLTATKLESPLISKVTGDSLIPTTKRSGCGLSHRDLPAVRQMSSTQPSGVAW